MTPEFNKSPWIYLLLIVLGTLIIAATFLAYFNPTAMIEFANMRLC